MNTIFLIVWVLVIVAGVISNIRKSVQKAQGTKQTAAGAQSPQSARAAAARLQQQRAQQARAQQAEAALRQAQSQVHSRTIASIQTEASQPAAVAQPVESPAPVRLAVVPANAEDNGTAIDLGMPVSPLPSTMSLPVFEEHGRRAAALSIFSGNGGILQAIIAQQVLGPPLALVEQSIWNQR